MDCTIKIVSNLKERLKKSTSKNDIGKLYGIKNENIIYVLGFNIFTNNEEEEGFSHLNYPAGVINLGFIIFNENDIEENDIQEKIKSQFMNDSIEEDSICLVSIPNENPQIYLLSEAQIQSYGETKEISIEDFHRLFAYVRIMGSLPLACESDEESISEYLEDYENILSNNSKVVFKITQQKSFTSQFIFGNNSNKNPSDTIDKFITTQTGTKPTSNHILPLNIEFVLRVSKDSQDTQPIGIPAPTFTIHREQIKAFDTRLNIDVLGLVSRSSKSPEIHSSFSDCLLRGFLHVKQTLKKNSKTLPVAYHFKPTDLGHFITLLYPNKTGDPELTKYRENLHKILCLSFDKPLFRRGNAYVFNQTHFNPTNKATILKNVHLGLAPSGVNGTVSLVNGNYEYYHYKQQGENDDGWGCAYRSLQTLFSWFILQGYTSKDVPSLREIQQTLVDIQDKPSKFVGSRDWIGSTEVSFVLDTLLGVTSRILNVAANETLLSRASELSYHFETHGTPVMIGGGVLAHTILGIDFNQETNTAKFLVLDPHYNGEENLQVIQSKGWCGWKTEKFWKKGTFYNMCLPMKQICV